MFDHPPITCLSSTHQQSVQLIFVLFKRNYCQMVPTEISSALQPGGQDVQAN